MDDVDGVVVEWQRERLSVLDRAFLGEGPKQLYACLLRKLTPGTDAIWLSFADLDCLAPTSTMRGWLKRLEEESESLCLLESPLGIIS
jgi:hypothetical protein